MDRTDDERAHFLVIKGRLQSHTAELERLVRDLREPGIAAETIDETVSRAAVVSRELEILKQVFEDTRRS
jgi:hypothetical protein